VLMLMGAAAFFIPAVMNVEDETGQPQAGV
jgi:hypothetical protein